MGTALARIAMPMFAVRRGEGHGALRLRLFLVAASGLVPLGVVLLVASVYVAQDRRDDAQRAALDLSRALATAVDTELRSTITLLQNVATSANLPDLDAAQLPGKDFAPLARRVALSHRWRQVVVADERGQVLLREGDPPATDDPPIEPLGMAQAVATGAAVIGPVARGPQGAETFAVGVPVLKEGRLRYVLSAVVYTDSVLEVLARQQVAPSWVVAVYDRGGNRVARPKAVSSPRASPSLQALVQSGRQEGMGTTRTPAGAVSHTGFSRVGSSQWVVAVDIPAAEANADVYRLLGAVGAGTAASLGLLAWLAWRIARGISGPIDGLKRAASDLGAGKQVELPPLGMAELDEVGWALRQAAIDRDDANARRDEVEREREQLLARLEEALGVAEQANRNKDEFLALLGHELRNPLAPITNAVHLLGLKGDDSTLPERRIIQRQLTYVTRLVDDLLDASRITSNRFVINLRPLRPVPVLEQTLESMRPAFGTRSVNLRVDGATRAQWVRADEARLVQVFSNLLGNATKFTDHDGTIDVQARVRGRSIEFVFRDNGAGMSPEHLTRAFDLFYQAPNRPRGVTGGLGLGLAIVKSLVEMHGGTVRAESDGPGRGTAVVVTLPLTAPPSEDETVPHGRAGAASIKVLVVDDNVDAADTLVTLLSLSGFVVQAAYTAQAAFAAIEAFAPEIIALDIGLPDMDGYQVARRLRAADPPFKGKLIALTGFGQQSDVNKALASGFDAHLTKPVGPDTLLQLIDRLMAPG